MKNNIPGPEFRRQLWINFSLFRLVAAPVVLALCAIVGFNVDSNVDSISRGHAGFEVYTMLTIYFFVAIVWGAFEAGTSMHQEMRANTWDFQRMSALSPAQLTLGKLFGSTAYTWYAGLMALAIFGAAYIPYIESTSLLGPNYPLDDTLFVLAGFILAALVGQAAALLNYFVEMTSVSGRTSRSQLPGGMTAFFVGFVVSSILFRIVLSSALHLNSTWSLAFRDGISWYGNRLNYSTDVSVHSFILMSMLFFLFWFVLGIYRLARTELSYRNLPFVWPLFVAGYIAWVSGFFYVTPEPHPPPPQFRMYAPPEPVFVGTHWVLFWAFIQAAVVSYMSMLLEAGDLRRYARLAFYAKANDLRRALENLPKWAATLPIVIILYLGVALTAQGDEAVKMTSFMTALLLFMVRDGFFIHILQLFVRGRGVRFAMLFYYVLVYGLLPAAYLSLVHTGQHSIMQAFFNLEPMDEAGYTVDFFYPATMAEPTISIFPPLFQAMVGAFALRAVLQKVKSLGVIANQKG